MNSCYWELVWLVSNRLKPVNRPIERITIFGPYLSKAQPAKKADTPASSILVDTTAEVAARVKSNSLSIDLKKRQRRSVSRKE